MSNEAETMEKSTRTLTPKRRFPEFRDKPGWNISPLGQQFSERQEKGYHDLPLLSLMDKEGIVPQEETNRKNNSNYDKSKYLRVVPGDIAYNTMRMWEGRSAHVGIEGLVSPAYTVCMPKVGVNSLFFSYYFKTEPLIEQFRRYSQGLVKDTLNLKYEAFSRIPVASPSPSEQQKIAECLSSLEGLITAEGRKLEALRDQKRGLMQQLFPQPGETLPRRRFPEFRDKGEWVERQLGDVADVLMCKRIYANETNATGGVPFYKIGTLGGTPDAYISNTRFEEYKSKYNFPRKGEILITCSGTIGKCLQYDGRDAYFQDSNIVWIDNPTLELSNEFLLSILSGVDWSTLNSTTITRIYGPDLRGLAIKYPHNPKEQRQISNCLSTLDDQITTQATKIESLKQHKRGLMQQLFPAPEEQ